MLATLDRTADLLDAAVVTVWTTSHRRSTPRTRCSSGSRAPSRRPIASLRGLQQAAGSVWILGAGPLGVLANRFGEVADSLDGLDVELATGATTLP